MSNILYCGCHEAGKGVLETVIDAGHSVDWIVCLTEEQAASNNVSGYVDYRPVAEKFQIPVYIPEKYSLQGDEDKKFFNDKKFNLLIQGGWQRLFPKYLLDRLKVGAVGVHGSADFLPKGRGRSPMNWSIIENRKRFIMSLFLLKEGVDDGDVFDMEDFDITEFDDIETLYFKYNIVYRRMLVRSLPKLVSGEIRIFPQKGNPTFYPKRTPEDGAIDWENMDVWQIYNFVRAQTNPYPGAFAKVGDKHFKIWKCRIFDTRITYPDCNYGEVVEVYNDKIIINCRGGLLLIDEYSEFIF